LSQVSDKLYLNAVFDEQHAVGSTSSASDGKNEVANKTLAQQLIAHWVMPNKCSGIHTVRVPKFIEISL
jgi:hypothetical protein